MDSRVHVRPAQPSDVDVVGDLWREMYNDQRDHGMLLSLRDDAVAIWKRQLGDRLDSPVSVILVAESQESTLIGFLAASTKRLPAHLAADHAKVGFISELFVRPEARRAQAGKALVDAALAWFDRAGVGSVELHVLVGNEGGRQFWAKQGFTAELVQMRRSIQDYSGHRLT